MTDESDQTYPAHDRHAARQRARVRWATTACSPRTCTPTAPRASGADAIVASAKSRGVPVVSARQMLTWLDGRNASSFKELEWDNGQLRFTIDPAAGANGLQAMAPVETGAGELSGITRAGNPVTTQVETIKGIAYATFPAAAGAYVATYEEPAAGFVDDSVADFGAGTPGTDTFVGATGAGADGEVQLQPAVGEEFGGSESPGSWFATPWEAGGGATVAGGSLLVNGARAGTSADFGPGRTVEFSAAFGAAPFQHVGFGADYSDAPWAMFSTGGGRSRWASMPAPPGHRRRTPRSRASRRPIRTATASSGSRRGSSSMSTAVPWHRTTHPSPVRCGPSRATSTRARRAWRFSGCG